MSSIIIGSHVHKKEILSVIEYMDKVFGSDMQLIDMQCSDFMGHFEIIYLHEKSGFRVHIENNRAFCCIGIIDPGIPEDDKVYANCNDVIRIFSQVKNEEIDSLLSVKNIERQILALYEIVENKNPRFYPVKRKRKIKNGQLVKYWEKYLEECT